MRFCAFLLLLFLSFSASSQLLQDDFTDTDLTTNPTWSSDNTVNGSFAFQVSGGQLTTNLPSGSSGTRRAWISSPFLVTDFSTKRIIWRFKSLIDFSVTTANNYARIYLTSNNADLNGSLQGYFLIIRDNVSLWKQDGTDSGANQTELITGTTTGLFESLNDFVVIREPNGDWKLYANSNLEGEVNDISFTSSNFFGAQIRYTANTRRDKFFFDDFLIEETPSIETTSVDNNATFTLTFRENLTAATAGNTTNYSISPANPLLSATPNGTNPKEVTLAFQNPFADNVEQTLSLTNLTYTTGESLGSTFPLSTKFTFTPPDAIPPVINSVVSNSLNSIRITFDENIDPASIATLTQYSLDGGVGNPNLATIGTNPDELILTFSSNLTFGQNYTLSLSGVSDNFGNSISPATNFPFTFQDIFPPEITGIEVIAPNSIIVSFSEALNNTVAEVTTNYEEQDNNTNPSVASYNPTNSSVLLVFGDNFDENQTITLAIQNIQDNLGNAIATPLTIDFEYDTRNPRVETNGVTAISATQVRVVFSEEIEVISAQTLNHYEITPSIGFPTQAVLDPNQREVLLTLATPLTPNQEYNLRATNIADLAGNRFTSNNRQFTYDLISPSITEVKVLGNDQLLVEFSELMESSTIEVTTNYNLSGIGNPNAVQVFEGTPSAVLLQFAVNIPTTPLTLSTTNLVDVSSNGLTPTTFIFDNTTANLTKIEVLSPTLLELQFSTNMDETSTELLANYSGVGLITSATLNNTDKWKVQLELTNPLTFGQSYTLGANNLEDESNNPLSAQSLSFQVRSRILSTAIPSLQQVEIVFDSPVESASASNINNYLISPSTIPIAANRDAENESLVRLFFSPDLPANQNLVLKIGSISLLDGTISTEETRTLRFDNQAPTLVNAVILDSQRVQLTFNEAIEETTAEALNHYRLNGSIPTDIDFDDDNPTQITLSFSAFFEFDVSYTLNIQNLKDLIENEITPLNLNISRDNPPQANEIIITEIMANPNDSTSLPNAEYIEIYNASSQTQALQGIYLQDGTGRATLEPFQLTAGAYLIICDEDDQSLFQSFGNLMGLSDWRSLSNTGEELSLISPKNELIFSVDYEDDWFTSNEKREGGWSLEIIQKNNLACQNLEENWSGSINPSGGTPGQANSIDNIFPERNNAVLTQWDLVQPNQLNLSFNVALDSLGLASSSVYQIEGNSIQSINASKNSVLLTMANSWQTGNTYELRLNSAPTCVGSVIDTAFTIILGSKPLAGEVTFNEIMADPSPAIELPEAEYIELKNTSNKYLQLKDLVLSDATSSTSLPSILVEPNGLVLLSSTTSASLLSDFDAIGVTGFPSLNNSGELLTLKDSTGLSIAQVEYTNEWYRDEDKENGGWSLERVESSCEGDYWVASSNAKGGTPNQVNKPTRDTTPPTLLEWKFSNNTTIEFTFSDQINSPRINISPLLSIDSVISTNQTNWTVYLQSDISIGTEYTIQLSASDCFNNLLDTTLQLIQGGIPQVEDIVFNEIMADPFRNGDSPTVGLPEVEYIELKNTSSNYLQLEGLVLSDATSSTVLPAILIEPNGLVLLSSTSAAEDLASFNAIEIAGFPSLNNTGERLSIINTLGDTISQILYSDEWYRDELKAAGGWSLERIENSCDDDFWVASSNEMGGTPNQENSSYLDNDKPTLKAWSFLSTSTLILEFNELVSLSSQSLSFSPALSIDSLSNLEENKWKVELQTPILEGQAYQLSLKTSDCFNNVLDSTFQIAKGKQALKGEIVFNEIMADPTRNGDSPVAGLPEAEYIELKNTTSQYLELRGYQLTDATSTALLPNLLIEPNGFLLLSSNAASELLSEYNAIGISSFPTLNNTGELLTLKDSPGTIIDQISYSDDWYNDATKAEGGWSLERIESNCSDDFWTASSDEKGGTPNQPNSNFLDNSPPTLLNWRIENTTTLLFEFSENVPLLNENIDSELIIDSLELLADDIWRLQLTSEILEGKVYPIQLTITDCFNNPLDTTFQLVKGRKPSAGELIFNELMVDPEPTVGLPEVEYIELFNTTDQYLEIKGLILSDATTSTTLPSQLIEPKGYITLSSNSAANELSAYNILGVSGFPSLNNSGETLTLKDSSGIIINQINYTEDWYRDELKSDGGWSLERLESECQGSFWTASSDEKGGTPNRQNSDYTDNISPQLKQLSFVDSQRIQLSFSEQVKLELQDLTFELAIDSISTFDGENWNIQLSSQIIQGQLFEFSISTKDCFQNTLDTTLSIVQGKEPEFGEIICNEIMADPSRNGDSPTVGLPEVEYIEFKNTTEQFLQLENFVFSDATSSVSLPYILVEPNGFVVLASNSAAELLSEFNAMGIASFPSLNNSGELLSLKSADGILIDQVNYTDEWYQDETKAEGGWSLERVENNCIQASWIASNNEKGGTPSSENSIITDTLSPSLLAGDVIDSKTIQFQFSELVNFGTDDISIAPSPTIDSIAYLSNNRWNVSFFNEIKNGQVYEIQLDVKDCFGNVIDTIFQLIQGVTPKAGELVINEIMADPSPNGNPPVIGLPEVEYIELKNNTSTYIQLKNLTLSDATSETQLPSILVEPNGLVLLTGNSAAEALSDFKAIGINGFPSLNNSGEFLSIKDASGNIIDGVNYSSDWYNDDLKKDGGWSLERIDPTFLCIDSKNWSASNSTLGGTPNTQNSIAGTFSDFTPPILLNAFTVGKDSLLLSFNESLDSLSVVFANYQIIPNNAIQSVAFTQTNPSEILLTFTDTLDFQTRYTLSLTNIQDCAGNTMGETQNLNFSRPKTAEKGDILISEILFNPPSGGVDFVELYNNSNFFIDLKNWKLADGRNGETNNLKSISESPLLFPPKSFLVLTPDKNILQSFYPQVADSVLVEMSLPTYPDDEGVVLLLNPNAIKMDRFAYTEDLHFRLLDDEEGVSLERVSYEVASDVADNWKSAASSVGYATPGKVNSQSRLNNNSISLQDCFEAVPEIFTPDGDGLDDFTLIKFGCNANDQAINIIIYDVTGREVKRLVRNQLLGTTSFFTWDGTNGNGQKVRTGNYLLWIEVFDFDGNVQRIRKRVVVGSRF